ncbi:MAG: hypothetical protein V9G19_06125 [Tetrasphaera sp.]
MIAEEYDGEDKYRTAPEEDPLAPVLAEKEREDALREVNVFIKRRRRQDLANPAQLFAQILAGFPASTTADLTPNPLLQQGW